MNFMINRYRQRIVRIKFSGTKESMFVFTDKFGKKKDFRLSNLIRLDTPFIHLEEEEYNYMLVITINTYLRGMYVKIVNTESGIDLFLLDTVEFPQEEANFKSHG